MTAEECSIWYTESADTVVRYVPRIAADNCF